MPSITTATAQSSSISHRAVLPYSGQLRDWAWIQPELAKVTRACAFDRSGCGLSMPGPDPRHSEQIAAEDFALLGAAKLTNTPEGLVALIYIEILWSRLGILG